MFFSMLMLILTWLMSVFIVWLQTVWLMKIQVFWHIAMCGVNSCNVQMDHSALVSGLLDHEDYSTSVLWNAGNFVLKTVSHSWRLKLQQHNCENLKKVPLPPTCSSVKMGCCVVWSVCGSHMNIGSEELLRLWCQSFMCDSTVCNFIIHYIVGMVLRMWKCTFDITECAWWLEGCCEQWYLSLWLVHRIQRWWVWVWHHVTCSSLATEFIITLPVLSLLCVCCRHL